MSRRIGRGKRRGAAKAHRAADRLSGQPKALADALQQAVAASRRGDWPAVEVAARRALQLDPSAADAASNLGAALLKQGRLAQAEALLGEALVRTPGHRALLHNLAAVYRARGAVEQAEALLREALALLPADPLSDLDTEVALCNLLFEQRRLPECDALLEKIIAARPGDANAHMRLGVNRMWAGQLSAAAASLHRAIALQPDLAEAHNNLGNVLKNQGQIAAAEAAMRQALRLDAGLVKAHSNLLLTLNYRADIDSATLFDEHRTYRATLERGDPEARAAAAWSAPGLAQAQRPLRLGLVSADLREHAVGWFMQGVLPHLCSERLTLHVYDTHFRADALNIALRAYCTTWVEVRRLDDAALAARIRDDGIDVLIDLAGHSAGHRLGVFARRPAPLQVTWLGYPNTTGLTTMTYRLVDAITDPPATDAYHSERLIRLPDGFLCYRPPSAVAALAVCQPPLCGGRALTFGSFNNLAKITPATLGLWVRILGAVPKALLVLKSGKVVDPEVWSRLLEALAAQGVAPQRLRIWPGTPGVAAHLACYHHVDIALDTFPYNGTTTTVEALWMGVPVVSECGDRHAARVGASILTRLELPELIAQDADEYVRIAVELAQDPERLRRYRATLRPRLEASALRDEVGFARTLEWALREMWRIHCAGEEPRVFEVPSQRDPNQPSPIQAAEQALAEGALARLLPTPPMPTAEPSPSTLSDTHWTLTIADEVKVCVPPDVKRMTTFVLLEQEEWFEAELAFLRALVQPGMGVLDIGANHGVYALSLAQRLHGQGRVIACEPASAPAEMLDRSIVENGFADVLTLLRVGLSDHEGEATLTISDNSEQNSLSAAANAPSTQTETIRLTTLDALLDSAEWPEGFKADLVKLDAEGEELCILQGGVRFFAEHDPLVLCDIRRGDTIDSELIAALRGFGLDLYRLIPGVNALVPVAADEALDAFQMNLFACRPTRAEPLRATGWLLSAKDASQTPPPPAHHWPQALAGLPYLAALAPDGQALSAWQQAARGDDPHWADYEQALDAYLSAADPTQPLTARWAWLRASLAALQRLDAAGDTHLATRLLHIRVLLAVGARAAAVQRNRALVEALQQDLKARTDRPLLPPRLADDHRTPRGTVASWLQAVICESFEHQRALSAYLHRNGAVLGLLGANPDRDLAMDRRLALLLLAAGQAPVPPAVMQRLLGAGGGNAPVWAGLLRASAPLRLCLGGRERKPGWRVVNIAPGPAVDEVADIRDLSRYGDGSCLEIYASHVLEHVPQKAFLPTLQGLRRLLRADGRLLISVPDMDLLGRAVSDPKRPLQERFHLMRMLFGGQVDEHDFHYIGLNFDILASFLRQAGFARVERVERFGLFKDTSDLAPYGERISLNVVAYPETRKSLPDNHRAESAPETHP
ncbi:MULTISPECIES: FkbM family methyltransferase [Thiorhodovibrio]|uniref:FkbM family methyltransferase n=1 Tax=Thiorhodovibrio TaxID=61593 RepID=UPI0019116AD8|nr:MULTISPECIES: FkbM family methyltransferase [Thiorhodovibrio]MBK5969057.1 hypothetical protein [Thiorhodovibrio winogradskyi]WPL15061.1 methyltransferase, FkbM family [Thiorhodovibrio litoralis]